MGTLQKQQDIYMESTEAHLNKMETAWEKFYDTLIDEDSIKTGIDAITTIVDLIEKLTASFGGGMKSVMGFGAVLTGVFGQQISRGINTFINNQDVARQNAALLDLKRQTLDAQIPTSNEEKPLNRDQRGAVANAEEQRKYAKVMLDYGSALTEEERKRLAVLQKQAGAQAEINAEAQFNLEFLKEHNVISQEELDAILSRGLDYEGIMEERNEERWKLENEVLSGIEDEIGATEKEIEKSEEAIENAEKEIEALEQQKKKYEEILQLVEKINEKSNFFSAKSGKKKQGQRFAEEFGSTEDQKVFFANAYDKFKNSASEKKARNADAVRKRMRLEANKELENIEKNIEKEQNKREAQRQQRDAQLEQRTEQEKQKKDVTAQIEQLSQDIDKKDKKKLEENIKTFNDSKQAIKDLQLELTQTEEYARRAETITNGILKVTSSLGTLATSWMSVDSLIQTTFDDSLDSGQKFLQIITNLAFTIPTLTTQLNDLAKGFGFSGGVGIKEGISSFFSNKVVQSSKNLLIGEFTNLGDGYKEYLDILNQVNPSQDEFNKLIEFASDHAKDADPAIKQLCTDIGKYQVQVNQAGIDNQNFNSSLIKSPTALAVAGSIVAIMVAISLYNAEMAKNAKIQQELAEKEVTKLDKEKELANSYTKTRENLSELVSTYEELNAQVDDGSITSDDLKDQIADLCAQYDLQHLKLQTIIGDYRDLKYVLKDAYNEALDKEQEQFDKVTTQARNTLSQLATAANAENNKDFFDNLTHWDWTNEAGRLEFHTGKFATDYTRSGNLTGTTFSSENAEKFVNLLSTIGRFTGLESEYSSNDTLGTNISGSFDLSTIDEKKLVANWDRIENLLSSIAQDRDFYKDEGVQEIVKYFNDISQNVIPTLQEIYKKESENKLSGVANNAEIENQADFGRFYEELIRTNREYAQNDKENEEQVNNFLDKYVSENQQLLGKYKRFQIGQYINENADDFAGFQEELESNIKNLDDKKINYIYLHLDWLKYYKEDINEFMNAMEADMDQVEIASAKMGVKDVLSQANNNDFKKGSIEGLFSSTNIGDLLGITLDQFQTQTYSEQLNQLGSFYIQATQYAKNHEQEVKTALDNLDAKFNEVWSGETVKNLQEQVAEFEQIDFAELLDKEDVDKYKNSIEDLVKKYLELKETVGDYSKFTKDEYNEAFKEQTEDIEVVQKVLGKLDDSQKEITDNYTEASKELNKYIKDQEKLLQQKGSLESLTDFNPEAAANMVGLAMKSVNSEIDNMQSAYSTLNTIIEDYNANHSLTLDNLQALVQLDDAYILALSEEGGQLSLNEQALQAVALRKLDELEATINLEAAVKMLTIAHNSNTAAAQVAAEQARLTKIEFADLGNQAQITAAQVSSMYAAVSGALTGAAKQDVEDTYKAWQVRIKEVNNSRAAVKAGGASFARTMSKGSKGGGGGGGGERSKKYDKEWEDEFDKWWEYDKAIETVELELDRFQKKREKMAGSQLAKSLKKENELLAEQARRYKWYQEALQEDIKVMQQKAMSLSYGLQFDAQGFIMNYVEATTAQVDTLNKAIEAYNNKEIDDEKLKEIEDSYNKFKTFLSLYEEQIKKIEEYKDKQDEILRQQIANNLEAWELELQVKLDLKQAERDFNSFIKEIETDFKRVYKDLGKETDFYMKQMESYQGADGTVETRIKAIQDVIAEINKMDAGGTSDMFESISQAQEKLKELRDSLMDDIKDVHQLWEDAWDTYLDGIDQAKDKFEQLNDVFDHFNGELEYYGELIELVFGEKAYNKMAALYEGQERSMKVQIDSLKQQKDMWEELWKDSGATLQNMDSWNEDQKRYYENFIEAQEALNDKTIEYIELWKNDVTNSINQAMDALERGLMNGENPDFARTMLNDQLNWDNMVKDDVERLYEIQSYENKINELIEKNPGNQKYQQELLKLREEELKNLREKENLTEHDIKMAELRLELLQKQNELEDAQNNKNTMKLTRNEQGNWSYQYVADEEEVASKYQEVLDAYNALYEEAKNNFEEMQQNYYQFVEDFRERLLELEQARLNGLITEEEYQQQKQYLEQWADQQMGFYYQEMLEGKSELQTAALLELMELRDQDLANYEEMTDEQKRLVDEGTALAIEDWFGVEEALKENYNNIADAANECMDSVLPYWNDAATEMAEKWNGDDGESVKSMITEAIDTMEEKFNEYKDEVDWLSDEIGIDFENIEEHINSTADTVEDLSEVTERYVKESKQELGQLQDAVAKLEALFNSLKDKALNALAAIADALQKVGQAAEYANAALYTSQQGLGNGVTGGAGSGGGSGSGGGGGGSPSGSGEYWAVYEDNGTIRRTFTSEAEANDYNSKYDNDKTRSVVRQIDASLYNTGTMDNNHNLGGIDWGTKKTGGDLVFEEAVRVQTTKEDALKKEFESKYKQQYIDVPSANVAKEVTKDEWLLWSNSRRAAYAKQRGMSAGEYSKIRGFASGGYTGEWGKDGKLAVLHEKELVLNKEDTANILSTVDSMRKLNASISNSISSQIFGAVLGLRNTNLASTAGITNTTTNDTSNIYNIDKLEFPNVQDMNTMVEALESLPLLASQYVNRGGR